MGTTFTLISGMVSQVLTFLVPVITGLIMFAVLIGCAVFGGLLFGCVPAMIAEKFGCEPWKQGTTAAAICDIGCLLGVILGIICFCFG